MWDKTHKRLSKCMKVDVDKSASSYSHISTKCHSTMKKIEKNKPLAWFMLLPGSLECNSTLGTH